MPERANQPERSTLTGTILPILDRAGLNARTRYRADAAWHAAEARAAAAGGGVVEGLRQAVPDLCECQDDAHDAEGVALGAVLHAVLARMLDRGDFLDYAEGREVLSGFLSACSMSQHVTLYR